MTQKKVGGGGTDFGWLDEEEDGLVGNIVPIMFSGKKMFLR